MILSIVKHWKHGSDQLDSGLGMMSGQISWTLSCDKLCVTPRRIAHSDTSDHVFRLHMISHFGVSNHPEMTPSGRSEAIRSARPKKLGYFAIHVGGLMGGLISGHSTIAPDVVR